jgi:hypothetical protein
VGVGAGVERLKPEMIVATGLGLKHVRSVLALDFNDDTLLGEFFCMHNGWTLSAEDAILGVPKIIWIGAL